MTIAERSVILSFAAGCESLRDRAIAVYYRHLPTLGPDGSPEQRFMTEVVNPFPDLVQRGLLRAALLAPQAA